MDNLRGKLCFKGERGYSTYEIAVKNGFAGTEKEWLEQLPNLFVDKPFVVNPELTSGETDQEKLQKAVDLACSINNNDVPVTIELNRIYNIDSSLTINKEVNRVKLTFNGLNGGGIRKNTSGELFVSDNSSVSDVDFYNVTFVSENESGLIIMKTPTFYNIYFNNCVFRNVDTAIYSETYLQSISFRDCLVTGGKADFINVAGAYYLNIDDCIIEHRKGGFLINQIDNDNTYNSMFFVTITNNLIEGFSTSEGGFANIYRIQEFSVCNNYFEGLYRTIQLNSKVSQGQLNVENNRLFVGTSYAKENGGFIYINTDEEDKFKVPSINFKGNCVANTYAIFFNAEEINNYPSNSRIYYDNNYVYNTFTSTYTYASTSTNLPFNVLPVVKITDENAISKYSRNFIVITGEQLSWTDTVETNGNTYVVKYKSVNYQYFAETKLILATIPTEHKITKFYFGIDIYIDDIVSVSAINNYVNVENYVRLGDVNNKHLSLSTTAFAEQNNVTISVSVNLCGNQG